MNEWAFTICMACVLAGGLAVFSTLQVALGGE